MSTHGPLLPAEAAPARNAATRYGPALREICAVLSEAKRTYRSLRCHESARGSEWCPRPWRRCDEVSMSTHSSQAWHASRTRPELFAHSCPDTSESAVACRATCTCSARPGGPVHVAALCSCCERVAIACIAFASASSAVVSSLQPASALLPAALDDTACHSRSEFSRSGRGGTICTCRFSTATDGGREGGRRRCKSRQAARCRPTPRDKIVGFHDATRP